MGITRTARFAYGVVFTEGGHDSDYGYDDSRGPVGLAGLDYDNPSSFFIFVKKTMVEVCDGDIKLFKRTSPSLPDDANEVLEAFISKITATGKREGPGWFLTLEEW